jgi:pimeloyl-ACP methyl ester carboxylesterase
MALLVLDVALLLGFDVGHTSRGVYQRGRTRLATRGGALRPRPSGCSPGARGSGATFASPTPDGATPASSATQAGRADIGGFSLDYQCLGTGSPTIILEAGYDSAGTSSFGAVWQQLAQVSRVCTYDRAGTGTSDSRPSAAAKDLTSLDEAEELHTLLGAADIAPPYVVVAHSYGGSIGRLFTATYPDEVQGLVLIESSHEDEIAPYRRYYGNDPAGDWVDGGDPIDVARTAKLLRTTARDLGSLPLVVIRAQYYDDVLGPALWRRTQADLATLSSDGIEIEALGSHHHVQNDDPTAVVAVAAVVAAARAGTPLAPCAQIVRGVPARCLT